MPETFPYCVLVLNETFYKPHEIKDSESDMVRLDANVPEDVLSEMKILVRETVEFMKSDLNDFMRIGARDVFVQFTSFDAGQTKRAYHARAVIPLSEAEAVMMRFKDWKAKRFDAMEYSYLVGITIGEEHA